MDLPSPLVKLGDRVSCQLQQHMTVRERQTYRALITEDEFSWFDLIANLTFIGEKRPERVDLEPGHSQELKTYLENRGKFCFQVVINQFVNQHPH